jgi:hypothetical protein
MDTAALHLAPKAVRLAVARAIVEKLAGHGCNVAGEGDQREDRRCVGGKHIGACTGGQPAKLAIIERTEEYAWVPGTSAAAGAGRHAAT